jgi:hypothetical protein
MADTVPIDTSKLGLALDTRNTATLIDRRGQPYVDAPVTGLRLLPHGMSFDFDAFQIENKHKRILVIGAEIGCDIVFDDETVSGLHCLLERHGDRIWVHDCDSKNGTRVNGVTVQVGELTPGTSLGLGRINLVAYGEGVPRNRVTLPAANLDEFLHSAVDAHGSLRGAAEALGLPYSTLRGWLKKRFGGSRTSSG